MTHSAGHKLVRTVDRAWRLTGTAISFTAFGVGAVVMVILVPFIRFFVRDEQHRSLTTRRLIHAGYARHADLMRVLGVLTYEVIGIENARVETGSLIVANHPSLIDVIFLLSTFRNSDCVVKYTFWQNRVTAATVKSADYIPNIDPVHVMEECINRLERGAQVLLFPEGTRTRPDSQPAFGRGAATIALRARVPIIPVRISCRPTTLTKSEPWYRIPPRRVRFEAKVMPAIDTCRYLDDGVNEREASVALTQVLHDKLSADDTDDASIPKVRPTQVRSESVKAT